MNRTVLNADVLLLVFSLAHKQTKLALMSTCQVLYREGGKQFLKDLDTAIWIMGESPLDSFLLFMDADGGSRMRYLHRLILELDPLSRSIAERFKTMLTRIAPVSRLTYLSICNLEPLLSAHPFLSKAIAELTSLKEINFYPVGRHSLKMLHSMRSELESANFCFADRLTPESETDDRDAILFLRHFSSTLRYLSVGDRAATVDPQGIQVRHAPKYPHLSHLTLDDPPTPITWHYFYAFPNLQSFTIQTMMHGTYEAEVAGLDQFRAENEAQLRLHGCWKSLDVFAGTVIILWLLGLPCPVSQLHLHDDCDLTPDMLRDALAPTQAKQLYISFYQIGIFLKDEFIRAFAEGCGTTLKELDLTLEIISDQYEEGGHDLDLGDVLDAIVAMLRSFSALETLTLKLDFQNDEWRRGKTLLPGEVFADGMDVDAMCATLHEAVPSASYVRIDLRDHMTRGTVTAEIGSEEKK